jgi:YfiH family protein
MDTFKIFSKFKNLLTYVGRKKDGNFSLQYSTKKEVNENKKKLAKKLNIDWKKIYSFKQYHSNKVLLIRSIKQELEEPKADGMITNKKNIFLLVKTADCFPVVFYDPKKQIAGAVHVGWRGAIEKIFDVALLKMISFFGCEPKDILIGIGPGIRKCCFKHKTLIQAKLPEWEKYIEVDNRWKRLDIASFIKDQLIEAGISKKNIEDMKICTNCDKNFYSHFRSLKTGEPQGRFATIIGLR